MTPRARAEVLAAPEAWCLRPALDSSLPPARLVGMGEENRRALLGRMVAEPWRYAASACIAPSVAPCLGSEGMVPRPVLVRMFLVRDRNTWRAMQGGLGCVLPDDAQVWPSAGPVIAKDVWVFAENPAAIEGPAAARTPPLAIRRTAGDMPSRVADNFFWLGRYLERLEGAARLLRITIGRLSRPAPTPHEQAELQVLADCLTQAGLLNAEAIPGLGPHGLGQALLRVAEAGARSMRCWARSRASPACCATR
ncbi:MAG: alpha-E domain-containing protein [Acetobacteraceae bacterium]